MTRTFVFRPATVVAAIAVAAACGGAPEKTATPAATAAPRPDTNYEPPSPEEAGGVPATAQSSASPTHGGMLVPLGSSYLEVVLDAASGTLSAFPMTGSGMPTEASTVELQVTPQGGAPARLTLTPSGAGLSGSLAGLKGATAFSAVVTSATIAGDTHNGVSFSYPGR